MIFQGKYVEDAGYLRPYIRVQIKSQKGDWITVDFLMDTGADETFLDFSLIKRLGFKTEGIDVKDDVGGIGGIGVPYFQIDSALKLISPGGTKVFKGKVNVFLDPYSCDVPLLGRDVLDNFVAIFDKSQNLILLLDKDEEYKIDLAKMNIIYNDKSDLLYIRLDDSKHDVINKRVTENIVLDIGEGDKIIGIEVLDASKHINLERLLTIKYECVKKAV